MKREVAGQILPLWVWGFGAAFLLAFSCVQPVWAQQIPDARFGTANPGRVEQNLAPQEIIPTVIPHLEVHQAPPLGAPAGAETVKFVLKKVLFGGFTRLKNEDVRKFYADKLGKTISLADVYSLAGAMTREYRDRGYILTRVIVPPQTIDGGIVRLRAIEGFLNQVKVENSDKEDDHSINLIRSYIGQIRREGPLQGAELERALLLINDLPGVSARAVLGPSQTVAGGSDLLIIVSRKIYEGEISVDNFGTRYMGPLQISGVESFNAGFDNNEKLTIQSVFVPNKSFRGKEMLYASIGYLQPIGPQGATLQMTGSNAATEPGYTLRQFGVKGRAVSLGTTLAYPFIRSRALNLNGHVTFDLHDITSSDNLAGDPVREDNIRALRIGGRLQTQDMLFGSAFNIADLEFARGLDVFGASHSGLATLSRPAGLPDFMKINAEFQRLQHVVDKVNLLMAVRGQMTNTPLLSSEQFGVGGTAYGRGYDPSEIIGDRGFAGKLELQWNTPYALNWLDNYQLYTFWDAGEVRNARTATDSSALVSLASAGAGARITVNPATKAGILVAMPLTKALGVTNDNTPVFYFNLSRQF